MSGISTRGPRNTLVIDRTAVPLNKVVDGICQRTPVEKLQKRFPITADEIFLCAETWCDVRDATENDFIELAVTDINQEIDVLTTGISDWVYLSILTVGRHNEAQQDDYDALYLRGIQSVFSECFVDIMAGNTNYEISDLHRIVFNEFTSKYGQDITPANAQEILDNLGIPYATR